MSTDTTRDAPNHETPTSNGTNGAVDGDALNAATGSIPAGNSSADINSSNEATTGMAASGKSSIEKWLLFNLVVPIALLAGSVAIVRFLGTVQSPSRPPIDDTRAGRLFALPAVDVLPVRSLKSTGQKLQLKTDGTVVPFREIVLATEVAGSIIEKSPNCESGRFVNKGDTLMVIDPTDYELEVKRLQRLRQQEYEALAEIDQEMANTQKSIELAKADILLQQRELKRQQSLPDQFASQGEVDQARRSLLQAEQSLLLLQNQIDLAKKKRVRSESAEQMAKMQLEAAENNLRRTTIIAPMDGVIVSEQAELNTFVARGSPIVTLEDTSKVEVSASLRTDQLYWVLNQDKEKDVVLSGPDGNQVRGYKLPPTPVVVQYKLSGRDDLAYTWLGELVGYDGIGLDEQTRTVPVRIVVDQPQEFTVKRNGRVIGKHGDSSITGPTTLVRGMFVNLSLQLSPAVDLVVLPSESLKPGNRVWQFVPNESVLDVSIKPVAEKPADEASSDNTPSDQTLTNQTSRLVAGPDEDATQADGPPDEPAKPNEVFEATGFDPAGWVAGQLEVIQEVRPIDRFIDEGGSLSSDRETEYWICEVPSPQDGSEDNPSSGATNGNIAYVIVSPLGSLQPDVTPVRASAEIVESASTDAAIVGETNQGAIQ